LLSLAWLSGYNGNNYIVQDAPVQYQYRGVVDTYAVFELLA